MDMGTIDKSDLYYEIYGEGLPFVILHGWGVDHNILSHCMESMFAEYPMPIQRIYIDLPGMGRSPAASHIRTSAHVLDALAALLDELIPGQRFLLMGESYGGYLARGMVKQSASRIAGLILLCPLMIPGNRQGNVEPLRVMERDEAFLGTLSEEDRASFEYLNVILTESVWNRFRDEILEALRHQNTHFLTEVLDGAFSFDVDELEEPFAAPCLILTGRQDTEVGWRDQFKLMDIYPNATFAALNRAGHNLQIEQPEQFLSIMRHWLGDNRKLFYK
jgi:pimeloyl-ACP methyl ester carboxylesterase